MFSRVHTLGHLDLIHSWSSINLILQKELGQLTGIEELYDKAQDKDQRPDLEVGGCWLSHAYSALNLELTLCLRRRKLNKFVAALTSPTLAKHV